MRLRILQNTKKYIEVCHEVNFNCVNCYKREISPPSREISKMKYKYIILEYIDYFLCRIYIIYYNEWILIEMQR